MMPHLSYNLNIQFVISQKYLNQYNTMSTTNKYKNEVIKLSEMLENTLQEIRYYKQRDNEHHQVKNKLLAEIQRLRAENEKLYATANTANLEFRSVSDKNVEPECLHLLAKTKNYMERISQVIKIMGESIRHHSLTENYSTIERAFNKSASGLLKYQEQYMKSAVSKEIMKLEIDKLRKQNTSLFELTATLQQNFANSDKITKKFAAEVKRLNEENKKLNEQNQRLIEFNHELKREISNLSHENSKRKVVLSRKKNSMTKISSEKDIRRPSDRSIEQPIASTENIPSWIHSPPKQNSEILRENNLELMEKIRTLQNENELLKQKIMKDKQGREREKSKDKQKQSISFRQKSEHSSQNYNQNNSSIHKERKMWAHKNQELHEEIRTLENELRAIKELMQKEKLLFELQIDEKDKEIHNLQALIEQGEAEKDKIITVYQNQSHESKDKIIRHQDAIVEREKLIKSLRIKNEEIAREAKQLQANLKQRNKQVANLQEQIANYQQETQNKESKLQKQQMIQDNEAEESQQQNSHDLSDSKRKSMNEQLQAQNEYLRSQLQEFKLQQHSRMPISQHEIEIQNLHEAYQTQLQSIANKNEQLKDKNEVIINNLRENNQKLSDLVNELESQIQEEKCRREEKQMLVNALREQICQVKQKLNEMLGVYGMENIDELLTMVGGQLEEKKEEKRMNKTPTKSKAQSRLMAKYFEESEESEQFSSTQILQQVQKFIMTILKILQLNPESQKLSLRNISREELRYLLQSYEQKFTNYGNAIKKQRQSMEELESLWWEKEQQFTKELVQKEDKINELTAKQQIRSSPKKKAMKLSEFYEEEYDQQALLEKIQLYKKQQQTLNQELGLLKSHIASQQEKSEKARKQLEEQIESLQLQLKEQQKEIVKYQEYKGKLDRSVEKQRKLQEKLKEYERSGEKEEEQKKLVQENKEKDSKIKKLQEVVEIQQQQIIRIMEELHAYRRKCQEESQSMSGQEISSVQKFSYGDSEDDDVQHEYNMAKQKQQKEQASEIHKEEELENGEEEEQDEAQQQEDEQQQQEQDKKEDRSSSREQLQEDNEFVQSLREQINELNEQIMGFHDKINKLQEQLEQQQEKNSNFTKLLQQKQGIIQQNENQVTIIQNRIREVTQQSHASKIQSESLVQQLQQQLSIKSRNIQQLAQKIQELQKQMLQINNICIKNSAEALEKQEMLEKKVNELQEQKDRLKENHNNLFKQYQELCQANYEKEQQKIEQIGDLQSRVLELEEQTKVLRQKVSDLQHENEQLLNTINQLQQENKELQSSLQQCNQTRNELHEQISTLNIIKANQEERHSYQQEELHKQLRESSQHIQKLNLEIDKIQKQALNQEQFTSQNYSQTISELSSEIIKLKKQIAENQEDRVRIEEELDYVKGSRQEVQYMVAEYQQKISGLTQKYILSQNMLKNKVAQQQQAIQKLQFDKLQNEINFYEKDNDLQNSVEKGEQLELQNKQLKKGLSAMQQRQVQIQAKIAQILKGKQVLEGRLQNLKLLLKQLREQVSEKQTQFNMWVGTQKSEFISLCQNRRALTVCQLQTLSYSSDPQYNQNTHQKIDHQLTQQEHVRQKNEHLYQKIVHTQRQEQYQKQLIKLKSVTDEYQKLINSKSEELYTNQKYIHELQNQLNILRDRQFQQQMQFDGIIKSKQRASCLEIEIKEQLIKQLEEKLLQLGEQIKENKIRENEDMRMMQNMDKQKEQLQSAYNTLKQKYEENSLKISSEKVQVQSLQLKNQQLVTQSAQLTKKILELEQAVFLKEKCIKEMNKDKNELKQEIESKNKTIHEQMQRLLQKETEYCKKIEESHTENTLKLTELSNTIIKNMMISIQTILSNYEMKLGTQMSEIVTKQTHLESNITKVVSKFSKIKSELDASQHKVVELQAQVERVSSSITHKDKEMDELKNQISMINNINSQEKKQNDEEPLNILSEQLNHDSAIKEGRVLQKKVGFQEGRNSKSGSAEDSQYLDEKDRIGQFLQYVSDPQICVSPQQDQQDTQRSVGQKNPQKISVQENHQESIKPYIALQNSQNQKPQNELKLSLLNNEEEQNRNSYSSRQNNEKHPLESYLNRKQTLKQQLKLLQQQRDLLQVELADMKKQVERKDKICSKVREYEKMISAFKKDREKIMTQLKLKQKMINKLEKDLKIKTEELIKSNRSLESVKEQLQLQKKRIKNFEQLYQKYKMQKKVTHHIAD